jgi:hypothetical protein
VIDLHTMYQTQATQPFVSAASQTRVTQVSFQAVSEQNHRA